MLEYLLTGTIQKLPQITKERSGVREQAVDAQRHELRDHGCSPRLHACRAAGG